MTVGNLGRRLVGIEWVSGKIFGANFHDLQVREDLPGQQSPQLSGSWRDRDDPLLRHG